MRIYFRCGRLAPHNTIWDIRGPRRGYYYDITRTVRLCDLYLGRVWISLYVVHAAF